MDIVLLMVTAVAVLIIGFGLAIGAERRRDRLLDKRIAYLEGKVNALYDRHGIPLPPHDSLRTLVLRGRRLEAVTRYRAENGAELKDAIAMVKRLSRF